MLSWKRLRFDTRGEKKGQVATKHALKRLIAAGQAELRRGDLTSAPFPFADGELDALHVHAPRFFVGSDPDRVTNFKLKTADDFLKEVWRVLTPGGDYVMTVHNHVLTRDPDLGTKDRVRFSFLADKEGFSEAAERLGFKVDELPEQAYRPHKDELRGLTPRRQTNLTRYFSEIDWGIVLKKPRNPEGRN